MLQLVVGSEAGRQIRTHGFVPELFDKVIAASGGPKWLPLAALDRHLLFEFFPAKQPLSLLGTSSGAWRCATLSSPNGAGAHQRLQDHYIEQRYGKWPTPQQVDNECQHILRQALAAEEQAICDNQWRQLSVIVCRGRHFNRSSKRWAQVAGLSITAFANVLSRNSLQGSWQRVVAHTQSHSAFLPLQDLPTQAAKLTPNNLLEVLLASGSIPLVLPGVTGINGLAEGRYFDGGVTDYHLDLPSLKLGKLTLYPHFYPYAAPGWFDKKLPWRRAAANFDKVAILAPTSEFIARLPQGRLPERNDFQQWDNDTRIRYWRQAVQLGESLQEHFERLRQHPEKYMKMLGS